MLTDSPLSAALLFQAIGAQTDTVCLNIGEGDLQACIASMMGVKCLILGFDYNRHHGSIGVAEASQIQTVLKLSRERGLPMALLIESSGIRVTDGTAGIASLRRVLRELMDARLEGARLLAMVTRCAFGGASLLACACDRLYMHSDSLLSMSGPKLIQQQVGIEHFNAGDPLAVKALMAGAARATVSQRMPLVNASVSAYVAALKNWLNESPSPAPQLQWLTTQWTCLCARLAQPLQLPQPLELPSHLLPAHTSELLLQVCPGTDELLFCENVWMTNGDATTRPRVLGLMAPQGCSARDALALVHALLQPLPNGQKRTVLLIDSPGHAATPEDEQVIFSEVLALLSLALRWLHRQGHCVDVVVSASGGGGIQAALAAGASSVAMGPQARLYVLPKAAMQALNKAEDEEAGTLATALATGAVDKAFEG